jgi:hypothetical protein
MASTINKPTPLNSSYFQIFIKITSITFLLSLPLISNNPAQATDFSYTGAAQSYTTPTTGYYQVELWGAAGGGCSSCYGQTTSGRLGAYTTGYIYLAQDTIIYPYIGQAGLPGLRNVNYTRPATFNGGGAGGYHRGNSYGNLGVGGSGGGATDIRLTNPAWNDTTGLRNRIMVAAGAGGADGCGAYCGLVYSSDISMGGTLKGGPTARCNVNNKTEIAVSTQTSGNAFGIGGTGGSKPNGSQTCGIDGNGGGGSGYWGGLGVTYTGTNSNAPGGGGSSYISGYLGAVAVESSTSTTPRYQSNGSTRCTNSNATTDLVCSLHYSGLVFVPCTTSMIAGNSVMPNPSGGTMTGNSGNGYARIAPVSSDDYYICPPSPTTSSTSGGDTLTIAGDFTRYSTSDITAYFISSDGERSDVVTLSLDELKYNITLTIPPHHAGPVDLVLTIGSQTVTLPNQLEYTLTFISAGFTNSTLDLHPISNRLSSIANTFTVQTNNYYGYTVNLEMSTPEQRLISTIDPITSQPRSTPVYLNPTTNTHHFNPTNPPPPPPDAPTYPLPINTWGFSLDNSNFYAVPPEGSPVTIIATNSLQTNGATQTDTITVYYGANIDFSQGPGDYAGTILYTVIAN